MQEDYVVNVPRVSHLKPYEKFLKKFKYKKALFASLQVSNYLGIIICRWV